MGNSFNEWPFDANIHFAFTDYPWTICVRDLTTCIIHLYIDAVGTLTTVPGHINGVLGVCPGETVTLTCTHNTTNSGQTRWEILGGDVCTVTHDGTRLPTCGLLNITMTSDNPASTLTSTAEIKATESMTDTIVQCFGGAFQISPQIGNVTIRVNGEALLWCCCLQCFAQGNVFARSSICAHNWLKSILSWVSIHWQCDIEYLKYEFFWSSCQL